MYGDDRDHYFFLQRQGAAVITETMKLRKKGFEVWGLTKDKLCNILTMFNFTTCFKADH